MTAQKRRYMAVSSGSRFILNASWVLAFATALFLGAFRAVTQTMLMKAQRKKAESQMGGGQFTCAGLPLVGGAAESEPQLAPHTDQPFASTSLSRNTGTGRPARCS